MFMIKTRFLKKKIWRYSMITVKKGKKNLVSIEIVAKALDGQRYLLPLCECMWV